MLSSPVGGFVGKTCFFFFFRKNIFIIVHKTKDCTEHLNTLIHEQVHK